MALYRLSLNELGVIKMKDMHNKTRAKSLPG